MCAPCMLLNNLQDEITIIMKLVIQKTFFTNSANKPRCNVDCCSYQYPYNLYDYFYFFLFYVLSQHRCCFVRKTDLPGTFFKNAFFNLLSSYFVCTYTVHCCVDNWIRMRVLQLVIWFGHKNLPEAHRFVRSYMWKNHTCYVRCKTEFRFVLKCSHFLNLVTISIVFLRLQLLLS